MTYVGGNVFIVVTTCILFFEYRPAASMDGCYVAGVYAFTLGCASFTFDAATARPIRRSYLVGCLLFDVGCALFLVDAHVS